MEIFLDLVTGVYFTSALLLMLYGLNCYIMIALFSRRKTQAGKEETAMSARAVSLVQEVDLPVVTTQIPIFNEYNVAVRIIEAVCKIAYPQSKHEVQVLDDSTDETRELVNQVVKRLSSDGYKIKVIRRQNRVGYKAGALENGLQQSRGELVAVFDADFVPPSDFWLRIVPYFMAESKLGLVQARWGHLNRRTSLLTRAESIGIDGHFMVEQGARAWNGLFMNFNGTAGVWRKQAIEDAGGWEWDTLTEDMDLSYRMQLKDWQVKYLPGLVVPAEIPENVSAFKGQQFRWAKGSIQTAKKILPKIFSARIGMFKKVQAFFHLTHYLVHPLMLTLSLLALPVMLHLEVSLSTFVFSFLAFCLTLSMSAPTSLYIVSQRAAYKDDWWRRLPILPALIMIGVGIALSNSRAVFEALIGRESGFIRTPKIGDKEAKHYAVELPWLAIFEIMLGIYCAFSLRYYLLAGKYLVGPFLAMYAAGFLFVGILTLAHALKPGYLRLLSPGKHNAV